MADLVLN
jgi:hypothetical protein